MDILAICIFAAVSARPVATNVFERPWSTSRNEGELDRSSEREALVEPFQKVPGAHSGTARGEIENRAVADIDPRCDPEIDDGIQLRPAHERCHGALIRNHDRQFARGPIRWYGGAVPQKEADVEGKLVSCVTEELPNAQQPRFPSQVCGWTHVVLLALWRFQIHKSDVLLTPSWGRVVLLNGPLSLSPIPATVAGATGILP